MSKWLKTAGLSVMALLLVALPAAAEAPTVADFSDGMLSIIADLAPALLTVLAGVGVIIGGIVAAKFAIKWLRRAAS